MGPDGILQLKEPLLFPDGSPAQVNGGFDAHILDILCADDLLDVDPEQLVLFILHPNPKGTNLSGCTANRYDIYRK